MTVEKKTETVTTIQWANGTVTIKPGYFLIKWELKFLTNIPGEIITGTLLEDNLQKEIYNDPQGFAEFANTIWASLQENKPPTPKRPRKIRSDRGTHKTGAMLHTEKGTEYKAE